LIKKLIGVQPATEAQLTAVWMSIGGLRIYTRLSARPRQAELAPIVCVHGLSVSSRYMVPTARRLAAHRTVYAPDLPGFGYSQRPPDIPTIPELAAALEAWMDAFRIERAVLLGNSMGCQVIARLARRNPQRVAAAVLTSPSIDPHARSLRIHIWRLARDLLLRESPAALITEASDHLRYGPLRTLRTFQLALADRIELNLPLMPMPTLVVRGEHDPIVPPRWAREAAALLPNGALQVIPGSPHAINYDCPQLLADATLAFLAQQGL
jgi:pimeloyl-ACP methyl ester carboxylesterase